MSESSKMAEDDIHFRAENNSNLNWEIGIYDDFQDFKNFVTVEFQKNQTTNYRNYFSQKPNHQ